ncbi:hypothetical protein J1605_018810 [Eschrichtius robustus]|uniref:Serine/threonine-protein kinase PLK1 n=1 Tax=Eschrichtius robustus TaxID=9764 RepID=A0AB34HT42_ESCRO|nr:hypothetical protein J1605_018810 [Eschrichtius robustus]
MLVVLGRCCRRRPPLEPHRRRKVTTQPEVRRYLQHMVLGCQYLHPNQVIHRDLKLGKLFLNDDLEVKIGDLAWQPKKNECRIPKHINPVATSLFQKMPQTGPTAHLIIHEQLKTSSLLLATSQPISHYLPHHSIKAFNRSQKPGSQQQEASHSPK